MNNRALLLCSAIIVSFIDPTPLSAEITVTEKRLENGDSEITVKDDGKVIAAYKINMSKHHHPALTANDPLMKRWAEFRYGAFLCYNSNQYSGTELCKTKDVNLFAPMALNVRQWVDTFKKAGMDHAVLTVRHTSDFLLWDSATSDCDTGSNKIRTDIVGEYVKECRREKIKPGFYYCLWGGRWNKNPNARAVILAQLHELSTRYGAIPYFWIDMGNWKPGNLSIREIYDSVKNENPDTIVMFNQHIQDGSKLKYFPTDVINGEMHQPPAKGHNPVRKVGDTVYYIPFEYEPCSQQRGAHKVGDWDFPGASWFTYGAGKHFKPSEPVNAKTLYRFIKRARERGASNVLMSCAPDHTGEFRQEDIAQLTALGGLLDKNKPIANQELKATSAPAP